MSASSRKSKRAMNIRATLVAMALTLSIAAQAEAQLTNSTLIQFTEPSETVVNGLTIQNVMFNYYVNDVESGAASVQPVAPCLRWLCEGALEGVAGGTTRLRMTFLTPMWYFEFALARASLSASNALMSVWTGPSMTLVEDQTVINLWNEPASGYSWAEGLFTRDPDHDPQNYLRAVEISFAPGSTGAFWIDNIEGQHAAISVPEPGTGLLLLAGLLGFALIAHGRRESAPVRDAA